MMGLSNHELGTYSSMVERTIDNREVIGSSPIRFTGWICHSNSTVECWTVNPTVVGSSPTCGDFS